MFSGIVEELGTVEKIVPKKDGGARMVIAAGKLAPEAALGDSVSINGVCLTAVEFDLRTLAFDLSAETLRVSNLGRLKVGDRVNLELSLKVGDRIGGHFVSGHVDAVGKIISKEPEGDCTVFRIEVGEALAGLSIDRGSLTIDGISLTVTKVGRNEIEVVIIPHTAAVTTLGIKGPGEEVNLEADMIGKYVAKLLGKTPE